MNGKEEGDGDSRLEIHEIKGGIYNRCASSRRKTVRTRGQIGVVWQTGADSRPEFGLADRETENHGQHRVVDKITQKPKRSL